MSEKNQKNNIENGMDLLISAKKSFLINMISVAIILISVILHMFY